MTDPPCDRRNRFERLARSRPRRCAEPFKRRHREGSRAGRVPNPFCGDSSQRRVTKASRVASAAKETVRRRGHHSGQPPARGCGTPRRANHVTRGTSLPWRQVEADGLVALVAAIPARRRRVELLTALPSSISEAGLVLILQDGTKFLRGVPVEGVLARALPAVPREVLGAGAGLAPVVHPTAGRQEKRQEREPGRAGSRGQAHQGVVAEPMYFVSTISDLAFSSSMSSPYTWPTQKPIEMSRRTYRTCPASRVNVSFFSTSVSVTT